MMENKILVAYFSASGVTARVAKTLAEAADADLFEIKPAVPYTSADLNWMDKNSRSSVEMRDPQSRPQIADSVANMDDYRTVFIGFPIWWYVAPTIINTFLESYDFSGKTIVLFATSGGSGLGKTENLLRPLCSGTTEWRGGRMLNGNPSKDSLAAWVQEVLKG
jgi:hypothetical protein